MKTLPNRDQSLEILNKYVKSETLQRHMLIVEAVMRHFAELYQEDPHVWGILGLLHDIDYELYPEQHCQKAPEILRSEGFDEGFIKSVVSHGYGLVSNIAPETNAEKVLYTIDELTGLIYATALMRPSKSILDMETKSVMKKFKTPSFAAAVDREVIRSGAEMLGKSVEEVVTETIVAMRKIASEIGLDGSQNAEGSA